MSNQEKEVSEIEVSTTEANKFIEAGNALGRLLENTDFKTVILDGYLKDECVRLVLLKADPNAKHILDSVDNKIQGVSEFDQYMRTVFALANQMSQTVEDNDSMLSDLETEA